LTTANHSSASGRLATPATAPAGLIVAAVGLWVLIGWVWDVPSARHIASGLPDMMPSTAALLVLMGAGVWGIGRLQTAAAPVRQVTAIRVAASLVMVFATLRLAAHISGDDWHLDRLGFAAPEGPPGQMAPATALTFILLAAGLLCATGRTAGRSFHIATLLGGLIAWVGLSQYVFGGDALMPFSRMAIHTAVSLLILTVGLIGSRSDAGLMYLLRSRTSGGTIARRLVPVALVAPILLGWLRLQGQRAGWFGTEAGVSLVALANVLLFGGLIWATAALLDRSDADRSAAEERTEAQLARLELLEQITRVIAARLDLRSIGQMAIGHLEDSLPIDFGCLCLYNELDRSLRVIGVGAKSAALAGAMDLHEQGAVPVDQNGLSRCVSGQFVYEPDLPRVAFPFPQRLARAGLQSLVAAPLRVESRVFGALVAARRESNAFSSGECEFIKQLSEHVALAAHQAQLHGELQEAFDELHQTQQVILQQERLRALGEMASGIAHDINNALLPATLYVDMLIEDSGGVGAEALDQLKIVRQAVGDVAHTVARLREFYRPVEKELTLARVKLNPLVTQVIDLSRARWSDIPQQRGITIDVVSALAEPLPSIMGIESEIREAILNLVFNAIDALPAGGTLTLRTSARPSDGSRRDVSAPDAVVLEVIDTGIGMDDDTRRRCLDPFFTTKGDQGTGLGLPMVYGIMQRHGGGIEIASAPGQGTVFTLNWPAAPGDEGASVEDATRPPVSALRILAVDDDPIVIKAVRRVLEADGHSVQVAGGGQAGIDAFRAAAGTRTAFDVVITDLGMPHVDGRMVAHAIKSMSPSTPVILLTGWGQRLADEGDLPPDIDHLIAKPPKLQELRTALAAAAKNRRSS